MNLKFKIYYDKEILPWIDTIATFRLTEFREFPYLYVGNLESEKKYLRSYSEIKGSALALAFSDEEVVAIATGTPLLSDVEAVPGAAEIFLQHGFVSKDFYYFGEFIVKPHFRHKGITKKLLSELTNYVKSLGYNNICIMTVDREINHPLKPVDYQDSANIWEKLGFIKTMMKIHIKWPTISLDNKVEMQDNSLSFWIRDTRT